MVCDVGIGYASLWVVLDTVRRLRNKIGVGVEVGFGIGVEVGVGEFKLELVVEETETEEQEEIAVVEELSTAVELYEGSKLLEELDSEDDAPEKDVAKGGTGVFVCVLA